MKKLLICLAALLLPLGTALAELPLIYPEATVISVQRLTPAQKTLAEYLYIPVLEGQKEIDLPEGTRYDDVSPAMQSLMVDYPELFHLGRSYTTVYWQNDPDTAIAVKPQYRMNAQTAAALRQQLYGEVQRLIQADSSAVGLHDALVAHTTYGGDEELRHTAVGALLQGAATCEGYAQALTLLYRMAGIPCGMVTGLGVESATGESSSHAWNIVNLGVYSLIDATWNDQERAGFNTHWYFGLSTAQMAADHTPDPAQDVPLCSDQAGWHYLTGRCAATEAEVYRAVEVLVAQGTQLNLRITDPALFARIAADPGVMLDGYNAQCPEELGFYGRYTFMVCESQQCLIIDRVAE